MKGLDIKTTIYDIFGYLLPGILLINVGYVSYLHSKGMFTLSEIKVIIDSFNVQRIILLFLVAYCMGHAISSLSSLLVEKTIVFKFNFLSSSLKVNNFLSSGLLNYFHSKFKQLFMTDFKDKDFRLLICFVESKQASIYSTAFVFLAFYGMARSLAFLFTIGFLWELFNVLFLFQKGSILFVILYFVLMAIFYYQYYRFLRYFRKQIVMGFIIPEN